MWGFPSVSAHLDLIEGFVSVTVYLIVHMNHFSVSDFREVFIGTFLKNSVLLLLWDGFVSPFGLSILKSNLDPKMNKDENCFLPDGRQDSALNLTTNGTGSISMSVELNGVVYTGEQLLCNLK